MKSLKDVKAQLLANPGVRQACDFAHESTLCRHPFFVALFGYVKGVG